MPRYSELVTPALVAAHLNDPTWVILDCRFILSAPEAGLAAYREAHVPGAHYADLERHLSGPRNARSGRHPLPSAEAFEETLKGFGIGPNTQVVAYDEETSVYASRLWWLLRVWWGHEAVAVLDGGLAAWCAENHPLTTIVPSARRQAPYPPPTGAVEGGWFGDAEVEAVVRGEIPRLLVDARGAARYRGTTEPLDPVAGHIPGARNRPFEQNLREDRTFRSPEELRRDYLAVLGGRPASEILHYCGSGVSACHNVLAMARAGFGLTALYPGSWSAWVSDPKRPVATGDEEA